MQSTRQMISTPFLSFAKPQELPDIRLTPIQC